jgi:hypothetical protein
MATIHFRQWECVIEKGRYGNGRPALILNDAHSGEQVAVATVNLPDVAAGRNEVFIKDYSENEGMLKALVEAGVVAATGRMVRTGFAEIPRAVLLPPHCDRRFGEILAEQSPAHKREQPEKDRSREM